MPILKASHQYKARNPKTCRYINEIMPMEDREVSQYMFDQFKDVTKDNGVLVALRRVEDAERAVF
jgi:hypothetical protein